MLRDKEKNKAGIRSKGRTYLPWKWGNIKSNTSGCAGGSQVDTRGNISHAEGIACRCIGRMLKNSKATIVSSAKQASRKVVEEEVWEVIDSLCKDPMPL